MTASTLRLALLGILLSACGNPLPTADAVVPKIAAKAAPEVASPAAESRYEVRVEAPETALAGHEIIAKIHIEPKDPWHMNTEFPVALRVSAPSDVDVELKDQRAGDAQCFDDTCLVFAIPFTPTAEGATEINTQVKFAVCGDAACAPDTVDVNLQLEVSCDGDAIC
ncbi:MAG TPA: hypothetical protein ENJ18_19430 [Nannocystis exedens]|nr:hypothetical protein [Nannocystis exedens]